jgi:hypothetical protein
LPAQCRCSLDRGRATRRLRYLWPAPNQSGSPSPPPVQEVHRRLRDQVRGAPPLFLLDQPTSARDRDSERTLACIVAGWPHRGALRKIPSNDSSTIAMIYMQQSLSHAQSEKPYFGPIPNRKVHTISERLVRIAPRTYPANCAHDTRCFISRLHFSAIRCVGNAIEILLSGDCISSHNPGLSE